MTAPRDSLHDPGALLDHDGVDGRTERHVDDPETFDYFADIAGLAAVGIRNAAGEVLLFDSAHGWRLPYGAVDPGADWVTAAGQFAAALTGREVDVTGVERVTQLAHRHENDTDRTTTTYDVVLRAGPVAGQPVVDDPSFGAWTDPTVHWFESVPEDAYHDHADAVPDIRRVLD